MLDYEWTNTSSMLLSGEEPDQDSDQTRQIFDQYNNPGLAAAGNYIPPVNTYSPNYHHPFQQENHPHFHHQPLYESSSRAYAYSSYPSPPSSNLTLQPISGATDFMIMKHNEEVYGAAAMDYSTRIGLNLGGRTYFSSEDDFLNRLYRRSRPLDAGLANTPRCQAEGCNADLTHAKHYHRRHKVCEFHSKAATVLISGLTQRFCQQCSRFHLLAEFDQGKRSCRKRLADHNRRRRKSQPQQQKQQVDNDAASSPISDQNPVSKFAARSTSSVTIKMSPPRVSLGSFRSLTDGQASAASSPSTSSLSRW